MGKKSGSGDIPDHFSRSLETVFWVKNTFSLRCGSGIRNLFDPGSGVEKFGSEMFIPDPQRCKYHTMNRRYVSKRTDLKRKQDLLLMAKGRLSPGGGSPS
jgi:hypothetical protein